MERALSKYAKVFDNTNPNYNKNWESNLLFLRCCQQQVNDLLKVRKTLFLNEVYDMLGFTRTQEGQVVGWHYDEKNPIGDNFVKFELVTLDIKVMSNSVALDFNVDGKVDQYL